MAILGCGSLVLNNNNNDNNNNKRAGIFVCTTWVAIHNLHSYVYAHIYTV